MVRHKQPPSLFCLCHAWFCRYLGEKVLSGYEGVGGGLGTGTGIGNTNNNQTLSNIRLKLRPFFVEHLPVVIRTSLLEEVAQGLKAGGGDCDYGRSMLYLLNLLLSKEVKRLKVTLCCYYGCRDMEGVLRCIKKYGSSLEHLELSRTSLLRMDPLLFRNVLTSATNLSTLVVKNICSDAMLKLIGTHCASLQYLDISNSKQVSDMGIESLCFQVQIRDKRDIQDSSDPTGVIQIVEEASPQTVAATPSTSAASSGLASGAAPQSNPNFMTFHRKVDHPSMPVRMREEEFESTGSSEEPVVGCGGHLPSWRVLRQKMRKCITNNTSSQELQQECLVEFKQVLHPLCSSLKVFDITDTSVTNAGLIIILQKLVKLNSLGEYSISDNFLKGLFVVPYLSVDKFGLLSVHTRKVSYGGMYNMVHVMPQIQSLTCWEPQFDITALFYLPRLRQLTLLRIPLTETVLQQILKYVESSKVASKSLEKLCLEFILPDEYMSAYHRPPTLVEFDLKRIFNCCENLKVFTIEFKNSYLLTPPVGYNNSCIPQKLTDNLHCLATLVHVQLGQIVQNSAVSTLFLNCPNLKHLHANTCPDLKDHDLSSSALSAVCAGQLECFYVYEAPQLTESAFQALIDCFPQLTRFGNLTRWAVNCEGIQSVVRTIKTNNYQVEILCGSHWFSSKCSDQVNLMCYNEPPKSEY